MVMRDTGMRNARELYRMRVENVDWTNGLIFNPFSNAAKGRRFIPMSERVREILRVHCGDRKDDWVFKSRYKGQHIGAALVNRQWVAARKKPGCRRIWSHTVPGTTSAPTC